MHCVTRILMGAYLLGKSSDRKTIMRRGILAPLSVACLLITSSHASAASIGCPLQPGEQLRGLGMTVGPPEPIRPPATVPNNTFAPEGRLYRLPPIPSGYFVLCSYSGRVNGVPATYTRQFGPVRYSECRVAAKAGTLDCDEVAATATVTSCLPYEPAVVSLTGTVRRVMAYGPPNYGETPKTDSREDYASLHLDAPICTRATPGDAVNQSQDNVRDLQMVFTGGVPPSLVGSRVTVAGSLFAAITAHHHTKVLVSVSRVSR